MGFESNSTVLMVVLLLVVAESMYVSDDLFDFGKIHI